MIYYALTRMWMFHGEIDESTFINFDDILKISGNTLLEHRFSFEPDNIIQGKLIAKWRSFSQEQADGHNLHPLIEIVPDESTFSVLDNFLIENECNYHLFDCSFKITDYGYLNVFLEFVVEDCDELKKLLKRESNITRKINDWIKNLNPIIQELCNKKYINIGDDYFGIPIKLEKHLNINHTDTYLFEEIIILTMDSQKIIDDLRNHYMIKDSPDYIENIEIHGINQIPIMCVKKELSKENIYDIIEPINLVLAEKNTYDSYCNINYSIVELMGRVNANAKRGFMFSNKSSMVNSFNNYTQSDLRKTTIKSHYVLHCINGRRSSLFSWQVLLIRLYKNKNPYDESIDNYERSELIITKLIEEKYQETQNKRSNILDVFLIFISSITLYSTYVDVVKFFEEKHNDISNINTGLIQFRLLFYITVALLFILIYITSIKKKN